MAGWKENSLQSNTALRRFFKTNRQHRPDNGIRPVVFLLFAVLVPAVCLLWFMGEAMRNERFAARQKLADLYRAQLSVSQTRLAHYWTELAAELERLAETAAPAAAFARCVSSGLVESAVIWGEEGTILYPNSPSATPIDGAHGTNWLDAGKLEHIGKYMDAARRYHELALAAATIDVAARALQAEARCLAQAGQTDAVVQLVSEHFGNEPYRYAADPQGRLIAANAELMALELITNRSSPIFQATAHRLEDRLRDYGNPVLAAPQRLFLMKALRTLAPEQIEFPTLRAEQWAAEMRESHPPPARDSALQRTVIPDRWQFTTPNGRVLALLSSNKLFAATKAAMALDPAPADVNITLVPPDADWADAFVTVSAGEQMPGWRLALALKNPGFFEANAGHRTAVYLWTGILVLAGMGVLTLLTLRVVRRQMNFARLKNDLAATVSHELKTPLSSMRVLVETLLGSEQFDERQTRDYLRLIARENDRLGRVIQNFLTFSRMERRKHTFQFSSLPARQIVDATIESVRGRFDAPGCRVEVQVEDNLPRIMADPEALSAALINLLENAYKYSDDIKQIVLHASAGNGIVIFSVKDNGCGISPRERKRIFQPFYQVDQRLSRHGSGCGLGLSIVQFVATAHRGRVSVASEPGRGSIFTISLPVASPATSDCKEAVA